MYKNQWNKNELSSLEEQFEKVDKTSKTIPNDSIPLRILIQRNTKGNIIDRFDKGVHLDGTHDDIDLNNLGQYDLNERMKIIKSRLDEVQNTIVVKDQQRAALKAAEKKAIEEQKIASQLANPV